jgi:hypothetical protein
MTTSQIAATDERLRPAFVATLIAFTFAIGLGAGLALSQVVAGRPAVTTAIHVLPMAGDDMSAAAYAAQRAPAVRGISAAHDDMTAAAYAAMHRAVVHVNAQAGADMSAAAYAATHDR